MPTIPEHRAELYALATRHNLPRLAAIADDLKRRRPPSLAPKTSSPMTPEIAAEIRAFKHANPHLSHVAIGAIFNVNPGRVSEAIRGKRT